MKKQSCSTHSNCPSLFYFLLIFLLVPAVGVYSQPGNIVRIKALEKEMISAHKQGDSKRILLIGDSMLQIAPSNRRVLGSCYEVALKELGDTLKALEYLKMAVTQHPFDQFFLTNYSWLLLVNGQPIKALPVCKKAYTFDRSSVPAIVNYAHCLYIMGIKSIAGEMYDEALALTSSEEEYEQVQEADFTLLHSLYPDAGFDLLRAAQRKKLSEALVYYQTANRLNREFAAINVKGKTTVTEILSKISEAITAELAREPHRVKRISKYLTTMGFTIYNNGQLKPAIEKYHLALQYNLAMKDYSEAGRICFNIGVIYKTIRMMDSAYYYMGGSAYYYSQAGDKLNEAAGHQGMADVLDINDEREKAIPIIKNNVLPVVQQYNAHAAIIDVYSFLSSCYKDAFMEDSSKYYLEKCVEIAGLNSIEEKSLRVIYGQLASFAVQEKDFAKAKEYMFMAAASIPEEEYYTLLNMQSSKEIGVIYFLEANYDSAKYYFQKSINILYQVRTTLEYEEKMKFLASNTGLFNYLALCNYYLNDKETVFSAMEESKSLVLLEKLGGNINDKVTIRQLQEKMDEDEVYFMTYFSGPGQIATDKIMLAVDKYSAEVKLISDSAFVFLSAGKNIGPQLDTIFTNFRKSWTRESDNVSAALRKRALMIFAIYLQIKLENAAAISRGLKIGDQKSNESNADNARAIGAIFYEALIKPFGKQFQNKKKIIILTDGQLSFVPFESLIDEKGRYLAETYNISYLPSVKVANELKKRESNFNGTKVALIGDPVYQRLSPADMQLGVRPEYKAADAFEWNQLPETKTEIASIRELYKQSISLSEENCTEEKFKNLFHNSPGKYALVHFATHGHVMDKDAGLSSVVLNQVPGDGKEDGYLTAKEIESMKIPAQMVVLSACKTGKGILMEGEGVQGLSSAFLVAGANSLIVSLWSVADKSTRIFMQQVYKLVSQQGLSFKAAIQKVKQFFLEGRFGKEYQKPYYWAPFIYIGN